MAEKKGHKGRRPAEVDRRGGRTGHSPPDGGVARGDAPATRAVLIQAAQVLGLVLGFEHPADAVLSRYFRDNRELGHRDRGFIAETVYGVVRRLRWLRRLVGEDARPRALVLGWLARGEGWPMRHFESLTSPTEQAWVTEIKARVLDEGTLADRTDMPDWLVERLLPVHGEAGLIALAHSLNKSAPLDLRANLVKTTRERLLAELQASGVEARAGAYSPTAVRLAGKPALQKHPLFLSGDFEVQDEGSQLLAHLLQPRRGELVVDFCAGAGGKTLQLGAMMRSTGRLYAFDVSEKRLAKLRPRLARAGLSNVHPVLIDHERDAKVKKLQGKADRVLVDAPCSGLGTLRRNPDLKWRQTAQGVAEMTSKQFDILASAARLVKPGGRLVYATCSLLGEENDDVVDRFLAAHPDFAELNAAELLARQEIPVDTGVRLRLSPAAHDTDGFFAVALERRADQ